MESKITIDKDIFYYESNGKFIYVYGYEHEDGLLKFAEENDKKMHFHIHIPESIDGLPVLVVGKLRLEIDYNKDYNHNGYYIVQIHLPENTAFLGLQQLTATKYSVFVPNYKVDYYPRKCEILKADEGMYHFFAEITSETTCNIIAITKNHSSKEKWVWSDNTTEPVSCKILKIPSCINKYMVKDICPDSTFSLPDDIEVIHISEGIEVIGADCFKKLPYITDVYLPRGISRIDDNAFSYYEESEYVKKVPPLTVHYCDDMPVLGENAFIRKAVREIYEEYSDWGNMYAGSEKMDFEVIYQKN